MCLVPADVPVNKQEQFKKNYIALTKGTDNLFLFTGDQKIELLNTISPEDFFVLASSPYIGSFATHLGLIARYGKQFPKINYVAKLNGKTNLIPVAQRDPLSLCMWDIDQVVALQEESKLPICGVGYTIYLGSEYESQMLKEAAQIVHRAHQEGLIAILWMYPRGKAVRDELNGHLIAGAAGVAACLGADFAKIKVPHATEKETVLELLQEAVHAAGNTKVICAGGEKQEPEQFLKDLHSFLTISKISGGAVGRNIYQHDFKKALLMAQAIEALIYKKASLEEVLYIIK